MPRIDVNFSKAQIRRQITSRAQVTLQLLERTLLRHVAAGKHIANAAAGREADVPDPPCGLSSRPSDRADRGVFDSVRDLHRPRLVDEKHILFGEERDAKELADQ